jgi:hypothetical protein
MGDLQNKQSKSNNLITLKVGSNTDTHKLLVKLLREYERDDIDEDMKYTIRHVAFILHSRDKEKSISIFAGQCDDGFYSMYHNKDVKGIFFKCSNKFYI